LSAGADQQENTFRIDQLLKAEEVARILGISRSFAFLLMRRGDITTVRIGRSVRVRPQDLERFISQNLSKNDERYSDLT
jgi:excisionase family DNA binding protein